MAFTNILLALLVAAIWGLAFTVIHVGLDLLPPFLLTALRFFFAAVPLLFFIKPPHAPWRVVVTYGLLQGGLMFGLVFYAIANGMPAGLASLVVQCQVFFTIALAVAFDGERLKRHHVLAGGLAALGIFIIALAKTGGQSVALLPLGLTLLGALAWGMANIVSRRAKSADPVAFIVWSSAVAPPFLLVLSLVLEPGAVAGLLDLRGQDIWTAMWTIATLAIPTTVVAFAIWVWLLRTHRASVIMPFALLIPIFGFGGAAVFLGEQWSVGVAVGAAFVLAGLAVNMFAERHLSVKRAGPH